MMYVRDRDGNAVQRSRNLAGIRRYVGGLHAPIVQVLDIAPLANGQGKLSILFENGCSFETNFASFTVLRDWVRRWRNVHGAPLTVNGDLCGNVSARNPFLKGETMPRRELTEADVRFTLTVEPEHIPYVGNCSAIDDETDREQEEWIRKELDSGNLWAWCTVIVRADWEGFTGSAVLGACSYGSEEAFKAPDGYFDDLKAEAVADLNAALARASAALNKLES